MIDACQVIRLSPTGPALQRLGTQTRGNLILVGGSAVMSFASFANLICKRVPIHEEYRFLVVLMAPESTAAFPLIVEAGC
jgi:hypothetical protein